LFFVDPGAGTTSAADSFEFLVSQNNVVVDPQHVLTGPAVIGNPLSAPGVTWFETLPTGAVTLEVWGKNRAGTGPPSMSTFTVSAPPPPPSPQISAKQQGKNIVLTGQGFEASRSVTVLVEVQNSISNQQDTRHGTTVLQSTSDRKINDTFNPVDLFANEPTPYPGTIAHGELVFVTAANTDAGSFTPGHPGVSNIFSFNWS
jgi:hypothetical protein